MTNSNCAHSFKVFISLSVIAILGFGAGAFADPVCEKNGDSELCKIQIQEQGRSFQYTYEIKRAQAGQPTLIAIPGGPGQGLIGSLKTVVNGDFLPEGFGVILIDQRGVEKNDFGADPSGTLYTTHSVASDIIEVIQQERLTNYFVHGQSYGTAVATVFGNLISQTQVPKPRMIILSGVVSSSFADPVEGYNAQLARLISLYSPQQRTKIVNNLKTLRGQFGENGRVFGVSFINILTPNMEDPSSDGKNSMNVRKFFDLLATDQFDESNQAMILIKTTAQQVGKKKKDLVVVRNNSMPEVIKCHELTKNDGMLDMTFDLEKFSLRSTRSDCEEKGYSLDRPYNSRDYQIKDIPVLYVQGLLDPATPLQGAFAHYRMQNTREKLFVQLDNYAHTSLRGLWPCQEGLWDALLKGLPSFESHVQACRRREIKVLR